jgi:uncharacterized protein
MTGVNDMNPSENKRVIQTAFERLAAGETKPYLDMLADDISWTVIGTTKWSGAYRGKEDLVSRLLRPVGKLLGNRYDIRIHSIVAEGDMLVVEQRGHNTTANGRPYHNTYCWVCRMRDGKIQELTEYLDTEALSAVLVG